MPNQIKRTNPADVANLFVRCLLCDISKQLGGFGQQEKEKTLRYFEGKCPYTGVPVYDPQNNDIAYDHLIPHNQEKCGLHLYGNIVITTKAVNAAKHRKDYKDFILHDTEVIKRSPAEREGIIAKIERFRKESGYDEKVKNIDSLYEFCKRKYQEVLQMYDNSKNDIAVINFLARV